MALTVCNVHDRLLTRGLIMISSPDMQDDEIHGSCLPRERLPGNRGNPRLDHHSTVVWCNGFSYYSIASWHCQASVEGRLARFSLAEHMPLALARRPGSSSSESSLVGVTTPRDC